MGRDPEEGFELLYSRRWYVVHQKKVWRPPTDVFETDESVVVKVEIAGLREDDFRIEYSEERLTVAGSRCEAGPKLSYQQMEIQYGDFETEVYIPWAVDEDEINATYENGFLEVTLKKASAHHVPIAPKAPEE